MEAAAGSHDTRPLPASQSYAVKTTSQSYVVKKGDTLSAIARALVARTARDLNVDPSLALAIAYQEPGFNARALSPANAIGIMQVIPSSGKWAGQLLGRPRNLLKPEDNVLAGVAIIRQLLRSADSVDQAIAGYYQGLASVQKNGMFADTQQYVAAVKKHQQRFR